MILIGGAPGAGKSTLGAALTARLGVASLSIDDVMTAAHAVTTPDTYPDLHVMRMIPSLEYFTNSSVDELKADATAQHNATWPIVERVVRKHVAFGPAVVIDGWHLRPDRVSQVTLDGVVAVWLVALPSVLEARGRDNLGWLQGSSDPDRMLENFLARSLWYNELIERETRRLGMNTVTPSGTTSVDELCDRVLAMGVGHA